MLYGLGNLLLRKPFLSFLHKLEEFLGLACGLASPLMGDKRGTWHTIEGSEEGRTKLDA